MKIYRTLPRANRPIQPDNPKYEWLEKNYPGFVHTIFMQGIHAGVWLQGQRYPFGFRRGYFFIRTMPSGQSELFWYWDLRELTRVRNYFLRRSERTRGTFMRVYRAWERHTRRNLAVYAAAEHVDVSTLSDRQLLAFYERLYWANVEQGAEGYLADCCLTTGTEDWLSEFIIRRIGNIHDTREVIAMLTAPTIASYTNEEEIDLRKMARYLSGRWRTFSSFFAFARRSRTLWPLLVHHTRRYYWIENNYFAKVLDERYFAKKLYTLLRQPPPVDLSKKLQHNRQRKAALLRQLADPWLANVIAFSELMTHIQDYRKMCLIRFSHYLQQIFEEIERRTGITMAALRSVVEPEMADILLRRRIDLGTMKERSMSAFGYGTPKGYLLFSGNQVRRFVRKRDFRPRTVARRSVVGAPACQGVVRGTVRLVKNAHRAGNFKKGDILITNNTTPEFVPLMKVAGAIVTDQGGITSHAAIVSRELGIPCVIGTKVATQIFKDGDRVEVDANNGLVKKV